MRWSPARDPPGVTGSMILSDPGRMDVTEVVIVATARAPLGKAFRGRLIDIRPSHPSSFTLQAPSVNVQGVNMGVVQAATLDCVPARHQRESSPMLDAAFSGASRR